MFDDKHMMLRRQIMQYEIYMISAHLKCMDVVTES